REIGIIRPAFPPAREFVRAPGVRPTRASSTGGGAMPEPNGERNLCQQLRQARSELERRLRAGEDARAEQSFARYPALAADADSALEIIYSTEFTRRELRGEEPAPEEYYTRFPQHRQELEELFRVHKLVVGAEEGLDSPELLHLPVEDGTEWG